MNELSNAYVYLSKSPCPLCDYIKLSDGAYLVLRPHASARLELALQNAVDPDLQIGILDVNFDGNAQGWRVVIDAAHASSASDAYDNLKVVLKLLGLNDWSQSMIHEAEKRSIFEFIYDL